MDDLDVATASWLLTASDTERGGAKAIVRAISSHCRPALRRAVGTRRLGRGTHLDQLDALATVAALVRGG
jgi:hypothetical protein